MTNRAILYEIFVNEKFFGGVTMNLPPFLDWETRRLKDLKTSDSRHLMVIVFFSLADFGSKDSKSKVSKSEV